jgi:hypothetical protein
MRVSERKGKRAVNDAIRSSEQDEQREEGVRGGCDDAIVSEAANTRQLKFNPNNA